MFTQTHILVSAALFARPGAMATTVAGLTGALFPDIDVWIMFVVERLSGSTGCEVFHYRYWEEPWVTLQSVLNSIPLYLGLLLMAGIMTATTSGRPRVISVNIAVLAASALLHVSADFLLHHEDARAQWHPISEWVFRSPVSYWDPDHYGKSFGVFEIALGISLVVVVGRRFSRRLVWAGLVVLLLGYSGTIAASFMEIASHDRGPGSCPAQVAETIE